MPKVQNNSAWMNLAWLTIMAQEEQKKLREADERRYEGMNECRKNVKKAHVSNKNAYCL